MVRSRWGKIGEIYQFPSNFYNNLLMNVIQFYRMIYEFVQHFDWWIQFNSYFIFCLHNFGQILEIFCSRFLSFFAYAFIVLRSRIQNSFFYFIFCLIFLVKFLRFFGLSFSVYPFIFVLVCIPLLPFNGVLIHILWWAFVFVPFLWII